MRGEISWVEQGILECGWVTGQFGWFCPAKSLGTSWAEPRYIAFFLIEHPPNAVKNAARVELLHMFRVSGWKDNIMGYNGLEVAGMHIHVDIWSYILPKTTEPKLLWWWFLIECVFFPEAAKEGYHHGLYTWLYLFTLGQTQIYCGWL